MIFKETLKWLLVLTLSASANGLAPTKAVEFIDELRFQDEVAWENFLISPNLDDDQRKELKERVQEQISIQYQKHYQFKLIESKVDGDIGGAILRVSDENRPMFLRVITLSFCRVENEWKATPEAGRFLYTGFGRFNDASEKRQGKMESWLFERQKEHLERLEKELESTFKEKVVKKLDLNGPLFAKEKQDALIYFVKLCQEKDFYGVAGCLGLDGVTPPGDFDSIRLALSDGIGGGQLSGGWQRIVERAFLMEPLPATDDDNGKESLAMYYPSGRNQAQIFECEVKQVDKRWVIILPSDMRLNRAGGFTGSEFRSWRLSKGNRDRLGDVPDVIMKGLGVKRAETPEKAVEILQDALEKVDMRRWCSYGSYEGEKAEDRAKVLNSYLTVWDKLRRSSSMMFKLLDVEKESDVAICRLLAFSKTRPNVYDLHRLVFFKDEAGWYQVTDHLLDALDEESVEKKHYDHLIERAPVKEKQLKETIAAGLLGEAVVVAAEDDLIFKMPANGELMAVYQRYEKALKKGEFMESLKHAAVLKGNESELLAAVGADLRGRGDSDAKYEVLGEFSAGKLGGVTIRVSNARTTDSEYVMYGVHQVGERYFLMPTLLYRYEFGRGDRLLNADLVESFGSAFGGKYEESIKGLIEKHNKLVDGILKK